VNSLMLCIGALQAPIGSASVLLPPNHNLCGYQHCLMCAAMADGDSATSNDDSDEPVAPLPTSVHVRKSSVAGGRVSTTAICFQAAAVATAAATACAHVCYTHHEPIQLLHACVAMPLLCSCATEQACV
jgi:hypothetical protein